jgi:four helix bundle protein
MNVEDLLVYKKLTALVVEIHTMTLAFPRFEVYELGSQLRRSSNGAPANLAEGFGNKHTNIFSEGISRARGEIRETAHHLRVAHLKGYIDANELHRLNRAYEECSRMLFGLNRSLMAKRKR